MKINCFRATPIAAAIAASLSAATPVLAQERNSVQLEEVIVTARKRSESVMDIPASVQALSQEDIKNMGASGINDYSRFTPAVNVINYGVGSNVVVFRGANVDSGGYISQSTSAVYLDEISLSNTGEQPSVRMVDIARIEALAGPQGTLYGSDAQAGTMRIITNKPVMNEFQAVLDLDASDTKEGEMSHDASIVLNIPLVEDKLALRIAAYTAKEGGFIDNVAGHTWDTRLDGSHTPSKFGELDNHKAIEDDWNDATVDGWRAALRWEVNENWAATATAMHQEVEQGAQNYYDDNVGDLEVVSFQDESRDDEYDLYSLMVEGDLGFAQLISATSYYERDIVTYNDITDYARHWTANYCQAATGTYYTADYMYQDPDGGGGIYNPSYCHAAGINDDYLAGYDFVQNQDRITQELRLSSQGDTLDWLVGAFYEESGNDFYYDWIQPTATSTNPDGNGNLYQESISLDYWNSEYPGDKINADDTYPTATQYWYENNEATARQKAVFGEVVWHFTDQVNVTFGGRWFERTNKTKYYEAKPNTNRVELEAGLENYEGKSEEFVPKISVSYDLNDDAMVYALWTEGYRPGGTNRSRGEPHFPKQYEGDKIVNWETGLKSTFADGAGRYDITAFYMDWEDYQFELVDPSNVECSSVGESDSKVAGVCGQPWQNVVANAGDAHILGITGEVHYAASENLLIGMNAQWLEAEADTDIDLDGDGAAESPDDIQEGNQLPITAEWTGALWATYTWPVAAVEGEAYVRLQWSYNGETQSYISGEDPSTNADNPLFTNDAYDIGDIKFGLKSDDWEAILYVNNVTDERASYNQGGTALWSKASVADGRDHLNQIYTNRPREFGIRFIKRWGG